MEPALSERGIEYGEKLPALGERGLRLVNRLSDRLNSRTIPHCVVV